MADKDDDKKTGDITEGEIHAARDALNMEALPGHESTLAQWEASEDGKKWLEKDAKENEKAAKEEAKEAEKQAKEIEDAVKKLKDMEAKKVEQDEKAAADAAKEAEKTAAAEKK